MKYLTIILAVFFQSCVPMLSTRIEIIPGEEANAYWKKGIATIKVKNKAKTEQFFVFADQVKILQPGQKIKFFAPAGRYFISTAAGGQNWQLWGRSKNNFVFYQKKKKF